MQLKIFSGTADALQTEVSEWMQQQRSRIAHVLQSQSVDMIGQVVLTITIFYEESNMGTGLGFRRNA